MLRAASTALAVCALAACAPERSPNVEGVAFATEDMVQYDPASNVAYVPARTVIVNGQPVQLAPEVIHNPDFETIRDRRGLFGGDLSPR